jgi:hypothetical protein
MTGSANGSGWIGSDAPVAGLPSGTFKVCVLLAISTYGHDNMYGCRCQRKTIGILFRGPAIGGPEFWIGKPKWR